MLQTQIINNVIFTEPLIGDHKLIIFDVKTIENPSKIVTRRNWQKYSKQKLLNLVSQEPFHIETDMVQATWNNFENILISIMDTLTPLQFFIPSKPIYHPKVTATPMFALLLNYPFINTYKATKGRPCGPMN